MFNIYCASTVAISDLFLSVYYLLMGSEAIRVLGVFSVLKVLYTEA